MVSGDDTRVSCKGECQDDGCEVACKATLDNCSGQCKASADAGADRTRCELGRKAMSTTTLIILIVLVLFLFGGGGGYYWRRRR